MNKSYRTKIVFQWPIKFVRHYPGRDYRRSFTHTQQIELYERQKGLCADCGSPLDLRTVNCHHIKPWSEGGRTTVENGLALCPECHIKRTFDFSLGKAEKERAS